MKTGILITALSVVLAGCNLPFAAAPTPTSTATLVPSITPLPTFTARPSSTPEPTRTPRPFASATVEGTLAPATPTLPYLEPLDTPTASSGLKPNFWRSGTTSGITP